MCLAVPGEVEALNADGPMTMATVNFNGIRKDVCVEWVPEINVGDYVIVHAGFAINVIDKAEALENLKLIEEMAKRPDAYRQL